MRKITPYKIIYIIIVYIIYINIYTIPVLSVEHLEGVKLFQTQGFDQYRSDFENSGEEGTSDLKFNYKLLNLGLDFTSFELTLKIDSQNKEAIDSDEFTFPSTIYTSDHGLSRSTKSFSLMLKMIGNGSFTIKNRRHEAWYYKNIRNNLETPINTFITYDDTFLTYSFYKYCLKYMSLDLKGFIEAGRDTHESRFKRVNNIALGPEVTIKIKSPELKTTNFKAVLESFIETSAGIGTQKHDKTNWALVTTTHFCWNFGLNVLF